MEIIEVEKQTNQGRIDAVIFTKKYIFIIEFKMSTVNTALKQIKDKKYQIVLSTEVLEHVDKPLMVIEDMIDYLDIDNGILLFSTLLQPTNIDELKTNWWYITPRGGHISLYGKKSLQAIFKKWGFEFVSNGSNFHMAYKKKPYFANNIIKFFKGVFINSNNLDIYLETN